MKKFFKIVFWTILILAIWGATENYLREHSLEEAFEGLKKIGLIILVVIGFIVFFILSLIGNFLNSIGDTINEILYGREARREEYDPFKEDRDREAEEWRRRNR